MRITNQQLYDEIKKQREAVCPASLEQYEQHCEFINYEIAHREAKDKMLKDTAELLNNAMHELSLLKDRILIIETNASASWKMVIGISVLVGLLSAIGTMVGAVFMFGVKAKGGL